MANNFFGIAGLNDAFSSDTAEVFGADPSWDTPRTYDTVPTDSIQSQTPVNNSPLGEWSGFFKNLASAGVGYAINRDAAKTQADVQGRTLQQQAIARQIAAQPTKASPNLLLIVAGCALLFALKKG